MYRATAQAHANLALIKYFGKRDLAYNLPANGSLSLTLAQLQTTTEIAFSRQLAGDEITLNNVPADPRFSARVSSFLSVIRSLASTEMYARVDTRNNFPTAAGLASSASGFAALTLAATAALGLRLEPHQLTVLARRGSGSASRSVTGGIVVWHAGNRDDGEDSYAETIAGSRDWDIRVIIGITDPGPKAIGSTAAMECTRKSSPFFQNWIDTATSDLRQAIEAIQEKDFEKLGDIAEHNGIAMHAAALAARPAIVFWNPVTLETLHSIRQLRKSGILVYFTCDAGPQPKAVCLAADEPKVISMMNDIPGITKIICCKIGGPATVCLD